MTRTARDGSNPDGFLHAPVLLNEVMENLALGPGLVYADGTTGSAGHASAIAPRISPGGVAICLDRDKAAVERARERFRAAGSLGVKIYLECEPFSELRRVVNRLGFTAVDRILLDLGLSSDQLADSKRGFSFLYDGPLDMRQDLSGTLTAEEVVNTYPPGEIERILKEYGEERFAKRIASAITERRRQRPITSTLELAELVSAAVPKGRGKTHPATRTFQAIRMEVGGEAEQIERGLPEMANLLSIGGRLAVITFHSLEERLVKKALRPFSRHGGRTDWQVNQLGKVIEPTAAEVRGNPRSRSAKLRVFGKLAV